MQRRKINPVSENTESEILLKESFPIKVKFKWDGLGNPVDPENPCANNGDCGSCFGICVIVDWSAALVPLTQSEIDEGYGIGTVSFQNANTKMKMDCSVSPDNGDGKCRLSGDIVLSPSLSTYLGFNSVTVKKGTYNVSYSSNPIGTVILNIITN